MNARYPSVVTALALVAGLATVGQASTRATVGESSAVQSAAPASVRVVVVDDAGQPIPEAVISINSAHGTHLATAVTTAEGSASVDVLPRGRHRVRAYQDDVLIGTGVLIVSDDVDAIRVTIRRRSPGTAHFEEDVVVSAEAGLAQETASLAQATNSISRQEIDQRAQTTLARIATAEPGLYWQRTSPTLGAIFIRGLTGAKVNLFIDGVRFSNAAARGGVNTFFNLLDPGLIDSAEVTRGPSSTQYGSDALGGSVQLFSRPLGFTASGSEVTGRVSLEVPCWGGERTGAVAFLLLLTLDLLEAELSLPRLLVTILGALFSVSQLHYGT